MRLLHPPKSQILWKFPGKKFSSKINCRKWHIIQNNIITYLGWKVPKLKNSNFHRSTLDNVCSGGKYIFIICFNYHSTSNIPCPLVFIWLFAPTRQTWKRPNQQSASQQPSRSAAIVCGWVRDGWVGWVTCPLPLVSSSFPPGNCCSRGSWEGSCLPMIVLTVM